MRFFIVFLIFALSLAVSASLPDTKQGEKDIIQLKKTIDIFSIVSDVKNLCGISSDQSCRTSTVYMFQRNKVLSSCQSFAQRTDKVLRDVHAGQSLQNIKNNVDSLKELSITLGKFANLFIRGLPQEIPLERKKDIEFYTLKIDRDVQAFVEYLIKLTIP